jgi:hypothetical protein
VEGVHFGVITEDLHNAMEDGPSRSLQGLVVLSCDENMAADCSRGWVKDVWSGISCLVVTAKDLYCDMQDLSSSLSFFIAVICFIAGVEHWDSSYDVGSMNHCPLYLSEGDFIWWVDHGGSFTVVRRRGKVLRGKVAWAVTGGRHERELMIFRSHSHLLLTVWAFPPWA